MKTKTLPFLLKFDAIKKPPYSEYYTSDGKIINTPTYEKYVYNISELTSDEQYILLEKYIDNENRLKIITSMLNTIVEL